MSRLEELIDELCPNGVGYTELHHIAEIGTGKSDRKDSSEDGKYPFYVRSKNVLRIDTYEYDEEAIIIPGEGKIGDIFHFVSGKYALHQRAYRIHLITEGVCTKFLYYYMISKFKSFIMQKAVSSTATSIRKPMIEQFPVPVPPIEVQREIINILDRYTDVTLSLITELTGELIARKKQYEFYCDEFFGKDYEGMMEMSKKDDIKVISLGDLGKIERGKRFVRDDISEKGIPCIHYGDLYTHYGIWADKTKYCINQEIGKKMRYAHTGDVVIVGAGENDMDIGIAVAWMGNEDVAIHDACYIFKHKINPKYLSYYFRTSIYHLQIKKYVSTGKISSISAAGLSKALIPVPSLEEQQRIVNMLDMFNSLYNDISIEIKKEIEARKKQYEYYRDKLLTFKGIKDEYI